MTTLEMAKLLRELDDLFEESESFRVMISSQEEKVSEEYKEIVTRLEEATPGLIVVYIDLGHRRAHALVPEGN